MFWTPAPPQLVSLVSQHQPPVCTCGLYIQDVCSTACERLTRELLHLQVATSCVLFGHGTWLTIYVSVLFYHAAAGDAAQCWLAGSPPFESSDQQPAGGPRGSGTARRSSRQHRRLDRLAGYVAESEWAAVDSQAWWCLQEPLNRPVQLLGCLAVFWTASACQRLGSDQGLDQLCPACCFGHTMHALAAANDVLTLTKQRATHRRHRSSGAALVGAARDKQHAAATAAGAGPAAAGPLDGSSHEHLPHIHSSPSIPAVAAASGPGSSSSREQRGRPGLRHASAAGAAGAAGGDGAAGEWDGGAAAAGVFAFADADLVLEPGQSVTMPMWLHLREAGRFDFQCIWFCEPQVSTVSDSLTVLLLSAQSKRGVKVTRDNMHAWTASE